MNAHPVDPVVFDQQVKTVCDIYEQTPKLHEQGVHVISTDEKTGIQALERKDPTLPTRSGRIERREFEYIRHGTLCLMANFDVAQGKILTPSLGLTRTEDDYLAHITQTVATDPSGQWIWISDHLNTHVSASLVEWVAQQCGIPFDLGVKGESGILTSMETRAAFLSDPTHRIRFVFTPKHTSWLNQVEIWFGILVRRVLKRGSFASIDDLRDQILAFIEYFNRTMAKPFKWTYRGRPLVV
jgi:transposase